MFIYQRKTRIHDYILCYGNDCSEDNTGKEKKGRLEWHIYISRNLLFINEENADTSQITRNKKNVRDYKAAALREKTSSNIAASM